MHRINIAFKSTNPYFAIMIIILEVLKVISYMPFLDISIETVISIFTYEQIHTRTIINRYTNLLKQIRLKRTWFSLATNGSFWKIFTTLSYITSSFVTASTLVDIVTFSFPSNGNNDSYG